MTSLFNNKLQKVQMAMLADDVQQKFNSTDASLAQKVTKGQLTSADFDVSTDNNKLKLNNLADEVKQAMAGTTPINTSVAGKSITEEKYARNSIKAEHTNFLSYSKNLFNKDTMTNNAYVDYLTGNLITGHASYGATDYIPVSPNTQYAYSGLRGMHFAFYDANKVYISNSTNTLNDPFTTPGNAYYGRFTLVMTDKDTVQLELGSTPTAYTSYGFNLASNVEVAKVKDGIVTEAKTTFFDIAKSKNLLNVNGLTSGYYDTNGVYAASSTYKNTGLIPVTIGKIIVASLTIISSGNRSVNSFIRFLTAYDSNKQVISSAGATFVSTYTVPANVAYINFSVGLDTTSFKDFMIEQTSDGVNTSYEAYYDPIYQVKSQYLSASSFPTLATKQNVNAFLPSEICVAVGRTIEIYNKQVCTQAEKYNFKWDCNIGFAMKRKFKIIGDASKIGEYALTLTIFDDNFTQLWTGTTTIKIISSTITNTKTIVPIGDSLSNNKAWLAEIQTLSGSKITTLGTHTGNTQDSNGTWLSVKNEGRSGWAASDYLKATSYGTEGVHPFWDATNNRFSWSYYVTHSLSGISPSAVQIYLGTNGITLDPTAAGRDIKQMVDYIRLDDANIPIFLVFTLYRANQDGIGVQTGTDGYTSANAGKYKYEEDMKVFNLMNQLYTLLNGYTNLHFVPVSLCHDSEYNFGAVSTPINPRASQTEFLPVEGTHPQAQGYFQMADVMFSVYAKYLNS